MTYLQWMKENPELAEQFERIERGELPRSLPWPQFTPENGAVATRDSGGATMNAIAASLPELVGGSADLDPSTKTYLKGQGDFEPNNYARRNIHNGVREHAMAAVNNGIAYHGGLLPFSATFFNFVDYLKPALRLTALAHIHHIYVFTHDSVFLGEDGPTHEPIEQLAMLRAIPNLNTIRPADAIEVVEAWKLVIEPKSGPWVLVLTRVPFLGARSAPVEKGAYVIADANGLPDLVLIATGSEVSLALEAKKLLDAQGIDARVVSMPCWTLFAKQPASYRDEVLPPEVNCAHVHRSRRNLRLVSLGRRQGRYLRDRSFRHVRSRGRYRKGPWVHTRGSRQTRTRFVRFRRSLAASVSNQLAQLTRGAPVFRTMSDNENPPDDW
jgi:transketolase